MTVTVDLQGGAGSMQGHGEAGAQAGFWALALGSVGVVYGDIGTSPLYAMREALVHAQGGGITREAASPARRCWASPRSCSGR
jgi:hypothetical protein